MTSDVAQPLHPIAHRIWGAISASRNGSYRIPPSALPELEIELREIPTAGELAFAITSMANVAFQARDVLGSLIVMNTILDLVESLSERVAQLCQHADLEAAELAARARDRLQGASTASKRAPLHGQRPVEGSVPLNALAPRRKIT